MDFQPLLAIGATIGTNYMYSNEIGSLSDDNKLDMTPHSSVFSIWRLIYSMLILCSAYHLKQPWNVNTLDPFFYTCLFNQPYPVWVPIPTEWVHCDHYWSMIFSLLSPPPKTHILYTPYYTKCPNPLFSLLRWHNCILSVICYPFFVFTFPVIT